MDKFNQNILIFGTLGILLGFFVCMAIGSNNIENFVFQKDYTPEQIPNSESEIIDNCKGLNLTESVFCVRDNIEIFYVYIKTLDKYYDLETIKEKGGNCYSYSMLSDKIFRELGFNSKTIHIENGEIDHRITIVSNKEGYCIVDLLNIVCWGKDE